MDQQQPPNLPDPNDETSATAPSTPSSSGVGSSSGPPSSRRMYERVNETPPERIGPYRVLREIGRGGMGLVYLATRDDDRFHRRVAIKLIRKGMDTDDILRRFEHERQVLAAMNHPNIARLIDGGQTDDGRPYFVVEYVEGLPIDKHCDAHRLKISERLDLFRTVCSAVHYAHQNLVVHRDLKPSNILVTSAGDVKLLDFGIAKLLNPDLVAFTQAPTAPELRLMTPEYASPEQVRGDPLTTSSDVYSLGVLLYELLTGHRPYRIKTRVLQEVVRVICEVEPERPSAAVTRVEEVPDPTSPPSAGAPSQTGTRTIGPLEVSRTREGRPDRLRRRLSGDIDNIVLKAMRKEPQRRYASALALSEDIQRHLDGMPVVARPDSVAYRARKFVGRNRTGVGAAITVVLALAVGLAGMAWKQAEAVRERQRADRIATGMTQMSGLLLRVFNEIDSFRSSTARRELFVKDVRDSLDRLADDAPGAPHVARTLAAAHAVVGDVQGGIRGPSVGKPEDALASYTESVRLLTELKSKSPDPQLRSELAASLLSLADAQNSARKSDEALATYRAAAEMAREALAAGKRDVFSKRVHAAALVKIGDLLRVKGEYDGARDAYAQSFSIRRELAGAAPTDPAEARDIAVALGRFAQLNADTGNLDEAVKAMRESVDFRRRNLEAESAPPEPRTESLRAPRDLMIGLLTLGSFLTQKGELDEAVTTLKDAVTQADAIRAAMPDNVRGPRDLAIARRALADALDLQGSRDDAIAEYRRAVESAAEAVRIAPQDRICNESLRDARLASAHALLARGRNAEAVSELTAALQVATTLLQQDPERATHRLAATRIDCALALARWANGAPDATDALRGASANAAALAHAAPDDAARAELHAEALLRAGWALLLDRRDDEARSHLNTLLNLTRPRVETPGVSRSLRAAHADALAGLALLDARGQADGALTSANAALAAAPAPSPRALWALALAQRAAGDRPASESSFDRVLTLLADAPASSPDARLREGVVRDRTAP